MRPRMFHVVARIVAAGVVSDPPVVSVNVRSLGMSPLVAECTVLLYPRLLDMAGRRPMRRNVFGPTLFAPTLLSSSILRISHYGKYRECCKYSDQVLHTDLRSL
jgi:hypothetical protein